MSNLQIKVKPPARVSFTQWADGSIVFNYTAETATALQSVLYQAAETVIEHAIEQATNAKRAEVERQRLPVSRLESLDEEIGRLQTLKQQVGEKRASLPPIPSAPAGKSAEQLAAETMAAQNALAGIDLGPAPSSV